VTAEQLRAIFNNGGYWDQVKSGKLTTRTVADRVPKNLPPGFPAGTRSQLVQYIDAAGKVVAVVHQYLLPNGEIGASGKPDPKEVITDDYHYLILPGS
jgi:hypothetical protein